MKKQSTTHFANFKNQFLATLALIFFSINLSAAKIYVKPTGSDANTGVSWAQAFQSLNRALYMAANGDEIWVAAGTYKPQNQGPSSCAPFFYVGKNLKIYGGFAGTETLLSQRNFTTNETILSGDIGTAGNASDNTRLIWFDHVSNAATLDGFTLTDYRRTDSFNGAAIYNDGSGAGRSSKPTVANCKFLNGTINSSQNLSGWIVNSSGSADGDAMLSLSNCTFGTQGQLVGSAALGSTSSGTVGKDKIAASNCLFNTGGSGISAGVINNGGVSTLELANCSFTAGVAAAVSMVGGNAAVPSSILMSNCTVSNFNVGISSVIFFGNNISKMFENCVFSGNTNVGVPLFRSNNFPEIVTPTVFRKCSFMGNSGGGVFDLLNGNFKFENCQFSGNACAVLAENSASNLSVVNSTFAGNNGDVIGGGCDTLEVKNSIIWANAGGINPANNLTTITHNIVQGGFAGLNNFNLDPDFLAPVAFASAPTTGGNLRLNNCSPASNSGKNTFVPATLTTDLDGSPRIFGGATGKVDCGAFEKQNNLTQIAFADADGDTYGIADGGIMPYCSTVPAGFAANIGDCNDANAAINPGIAEICNGVDDNCDGTVDNVTTCPKPINLSTSSITPSSALTNWAGGDCPISYQVQYRLSTVTTYTTITVNAPAAGVQLTGLAPGTTYKWRLRAVCPPGNKYSAYTALQTFSTLASAKGGDNTTNFSKFEKTASDRDDAQQQFMSVFPNPSAGEFQIEFDQAVESGELFLYDLQGKLILKKGWASGESSQKIILNDLSTGIYLLRAEMDGKIFREKIMVE